MHTAENTAGMVLGGLAMAALILDGQTAVNGAMEGTELCIRVVIPSLFPMLIISALLSEKIGSGKKPPAHPLLERFGIPAGTEGLFLTGLLGGYPAGVQAVSQACRSGGLPREQAMRLAGLCSQCGPAFLFGIAAGQFSSWRAGAMLWIIQLLSALLAGALLTGKQQSMETEPSGISKSSGSLMDRCLHTMACVCAWVILFRALLAVLDRWILFVLPLPGQALATGLLELTNGCLMLSACPDEGLRFLLACVLINFGGVCVAMQAASILHRYQLSAGPWLAEKLLQTGISLTLAIPAVYMANPGGSVSWQPVLAAVGGLVLLIWKITVAKRSGSVYNRCKS